MDFDSGFAGPVDWTFPSPSATPTHNSFSNDIFHTPKASVPSHFQDAFATPQMATHATPRPQQYHSTTPQQQHQIPAHFVPLPSSPMYQQQTMTAGPQQHSFSPGTPNSYGHDQMAAHLSNLTPAQVRTPPPTRGSSLRKAQPQQHVAFGTPLTIASRRVMTPQHQGGIPFPLQTHHQTPPVINGMQMPQDFSFSSLGPATAPVQSSTINFWDSLASPEGRRRPAALEDPFTSSGAQTDLDNTFTSAPSSQSSQAMSANLSSGLTFAFDNALSTIPSSQDTTASTDSMPTSVDPSLVYSSPIRALPRPNSRIERLPLHSTHLDAKRRVASSTRHARTDTSSSGESTSRQSTGLRRSNTTGSSRSALSGDIFERVQPPRTASPLKRVGRTPLGSISESARQRPRSSVVLTVDDTGLARTQTYEEDDSPTRAMRAKYPALFDSDSSDAESDAASDLSSSKASFAFNRRDERQQKSVRLDPPIGELAGLSIPRSASSNSLVGPSRAAVAAAAQLRRQGSLRKVNSVRRSSSRRSLAAPIDTCPMNAGSSSWQGDDSPEHDAEFDFLPAVPRPQRSSSAMQNTLAAHNRRWNMLSTEHTHPGAAMSYSRQMRCVCGTSAEQGPLVQCHLCTQWSHGGCVGVEDASAGFTCFLCTRPARSHVASITM